ncbi:hypothetical protein ASH00_09020 [Arthrobacter sp. Soil782]|uniref:glutaredoxin domain-containing protein n=1 Tax=Arthrobacter sp. Soil782 TaxID=1736410 RepID=UPI0006FF45FB|nr:glutaredoxin domain-containing protein [Arthrobacter sp. Soil782]KRF05598.1 hypothetical protein ASH00_09020 [Arthrobacter sp. Soil782]
MTENPSLTVLPSPKTVVMYSKSQCVQCDAMKRAIAKTDVLVNELDATTAENRQLCIDLGYMQAPVTVVYQNGEITDSWSGFNPNKVNELKNDPLVVRVPTGGHELAA